MIYEIWYNYIYMTYDIIIYNYVCVIYIHILTYKLLCVCSYVVHRYDIVTSRSVHIYIYIYLITTYMYITYMYISSASLQAVETRVQHWYGETSFSLCQHSSSPRTNWNNKRELKPRGVQRKTLQLGCRRKNTPSVSDKCFSFITFQMKSAPQDSSAAGLGAAAMDFHRFVWWEWQHKD